MSDLFLETGDGTRLVDPSGAQVRQALMSLHGAPEPFVVLASEDGRLVQAHGSHIDGFVLDYRPASGALIRRVEGSTVPLDVALRVFEAVRSGDARPLGDLAWQFKPSDRAPDPGTDGQRRWASWWIAIFGLVLLGLGFLLEWDVGKRAGFFVGSFFFFASIADGFRTGTIEGKSGRFSQIVDPGRFMMEVAIQLILGASLLAVAAAW